MATKKMAKDPGPAPKGRMPNMAGVPGELVDEAALPAGVAWGSKTRISPYDPLLRQLAEAGPGKALKFGDTRARTSINVRAKKLGLRVTCGEAGGALFVRFEGRVDDNKRETRREIIRGALKITVGATAMALTNTLREKGDASVDVNIVEAILAQMAKAGEVVQQDSGGWRLNPMRRVA